MPTSSHLVNELSAFLHSIEARLQPYEIAIHPPSLCFCHQREQVPARELLTLI